MEEEIYKLFYDMYNASDKLSVDNQIKSILLNKKIRSKNKQNYIESLILNNLFFANKIYNITYMLSNLIVNELLTFNDVIVYVNNAEQEFNNIPREEILNKYNLSFPNKPENELINQLEFDYKYNTYQINELLAILDHKQEYILSLRNKKRSDFVSSEHVNGLISKYSNYNAKKFANINEQSENGGVESVKYGFVDLGSKKQGEFIKLNEVNNNKNEIVNIKNECNDASSSDASFLGRINGMTEGDLKLFVDKYYNKFVEIHGNEVSFGPNVVYDFILSIFLAIHDMTTKQKIFDEIKCVFLGFYKPNEFTGKMFDIVSNSNIKYDTWLSAKYLLKSNHEWVLKHKSSLIFKVDSIDEVCNLKTNDSNCTVGNLNDVSNTISETHNEISSVLRPSIPTGLYFFTIVCCFPISLLAILPGYFAQKSLIKNGEYEEARESIKSLSLLCYFGLAAVFLSAFAILIQFGAIVKILLSV